MDLVIRLLVKLLTIPRHLTFSGAVHIFFVLSGIATLYLLTIKQNEEGRIEDYLQRLWKRVSALKTQALAKHLTFIQITASALTNGLDRLFGPRLFSIQAIGVSVAFALFFSNVYFLSQEGRTDFFDHIWDCVVTICLALTPALITKTFKPNCNVKFVGFTPTRCHYFNHYHYHNIFEHSLIRLGETYNFQCFCSSGWMIIWFGSLILYIYKEYFSLLGCVTCFPSVFRPFLIIIVVLIISFATVGSLFFAVFTVVTRFSLKKLSASNSPSKTIMLLLVGFFPIPIFFLLLELLIFLLKHGLNSNDQHHVTKQEWAVIGIFLIAVVAILINMLFLITPILFLLMATLLLIHRLLWPMVERPLDKLNRMGIMKHPKVIAALGLIQILFGLGKLDWVEKLLKLIGIG
jgi:hypothetical protein